MDKMWWLYYAIMVLYALFPGTAPLRITNLDVPKTAWNTVPLNCRYDLDGDENFYAAKWYKDNREFFRCIKNGSTFRFPLDGINKIDTSGFSHIGACYLELMDLDDKSSGEYTCEISLEFPRFDIVSKSAVLKVVDPPPNEEKTALEGQPQENDSTETSDHQLSPVTMKGTQNFPAIMTKTSGIFLIMFAWLYFY